jgi:protein-disulfide isomerase
MKDESELVKIVRPVDDDDHVLGPQSASVTLVEYGDYECIYCRQLHPIIREVLRRTEGLRFVYRHFPISKVHPHAARAAQAAEAAAAQGRFWEMHDVLFEQDQLLDDDQLARCARKAGLDMERYTTEMGADAYAGKVAKDFTAAMFVGQVTATPTLYLNGRHRSDIQGVTGLLAAVTEAGATLHVNFNGWPKWRSRLRK